MVLVRTDVLEERVVYIIRVRRISEAGTLAVSSDGYFYPDDGGDMFLRNVGSYKSHTMSHPRRWNSSFFKAFAKGNSRILA
jgi:hypothetical protein